jgi:hypothetical protein
VRGADACPLIATRALRAPCEELPYTEQLSASNGQPPYQWALLDGPSWLSFDPATQTLSGLPRPGASTAATFELVDAGGHRRQATYSLAPRSSCSFAYVSSGGEAPGLHYADVFGSDDVVLSQAVGPDLPVADFSFSPDGRFIAFRAGNIDEQGLYVVTLPAGPVGEAQPSGPVPFVCSTPDAGADPTPCSVLEYAWSPDSRRLAVSLGEPGSVDNLLSVVGVDALDAPGPVVDAKWRQGLAWVGTTALVFSGGRAAQPELQYPSYSILPATGLTLSSPVSTSVPASEWTLRTTPSGAFFFDGNVDLIHLNLLGQPAIEAHAPGWLSPSGLYTAAANAEGRLQLYTVGAPAMPIAESEPGECEVVFAWAERREVIACVRSLDSATGVAATESQLIEGVPFSHGSGLRIFELDASATFQRRLRQWTIGADRYFPVETAGRRRALSPDGSWLVFYGADANGTEILQGVDASTESTFGFRATSASDAASIELAISPVGNAYATYGQGLEHRASPDRATDVHLVTAELGSLFVPAEGTPCAEEPYANPERWCGSPSMYNHFTFSPDGRMLLIEDARRALWSADTGADDPIVQHLEVTLPECEGPCDDRRYAFRPTVVP